MLSTVLQHLKEAIVVTDRDDNILYASPNCEAVIGLSDNAIYRHGKMDDLLTNFRNGTAVHDLSKRSSMFEMTVPVENDNPRTVLVRSVTGVGDTAISYIFTGEKRKETAEITTGLQEQVLAALPEGVCIVREDSHEVTYFNEAFRKIFDESSINMLGKSIWNFFSQTALLPENEISVIRRAMLENRGWTGGEYTLTKEGRTCWVSLSISCFDHNCHGRVWLVLFSDISTYKQNEKELTQRNEELEMRIEEQTFELKRKSIALAEILNQLEVERNNLAQKIDMNIQKLLLPVLEKLIEKSSSLDSRYLIMIKQNLQNLTSSLGIKLSSAEYQLTPKEIELCTLIKSGFTIKEIAVMHNLSERTVETHRFNIRKKLGLSSSKINLASFLLEL